MTTGLVGQPSAGIPIPQPRPSGWLQRSRPHLVEQESPEEELAAIALAVFAFHQQHHERSQLPAGPSAWALAGRSKQMEPFVKAWRR
jgi:hypothetical protein